LTRIATGFVRVGTFEYFSAKRNVEAIKQLADYEIDRHYPEAKEADNPYPAFLEAVVDRQAKLIAQWMSLGFIHGVMNTDNMSIAGETIDYGPCAFMDEFEHDRVYSSIDQHGRYAYSNQPKIGQWNLVRLAEALLPLFIDRTITTDGTSSTNGSKSADGSSAEGSNETNKKAEAAVEIAQDILNAYERQYKTYWLEGMRSKLGLLVPQESDFSLVEELLDCMESSKADFTLTFYYLSQLSASSNDSVSEYDQAIQQLFANSDEFNIWLKKWRERIAEEPQNETERQAIMNAINPVYIPRNHQIEAAIRAAEDNNDFSVFHALNEVLQNPFILQEGKESYMLPPLPEEVVHQTFCGT